jgi:acylphosphatase
MKTTVRIRAEGQVQGVGYRAFVELNATQLNIDGWVRNRRDGSVEALFQGDPESVAKLIERCRRGPTGALVTKFEVTEEDAEASADSSCHQRFSLHLMNGVTCGPPA